MNKGLEAFERIIESFYDKESDDIKTVKKYLKALEIIKEKLSPLARYTFLPMTQEEFELVEEIFL